MSKIKVERQGECPQILKEIGRWVLYVIGGVLGAIGIWAVMWVMYIIFGA